MLKKILFILLALLLLCFNISVYGGDEYESKEILVGKEDYITISSRGGTWKIGYRCYPEFRFTITESKKGLLKEGKTIYFSTDTAFEIERGITAICENGTIKFQDDILRKVDENVYAIHLKKVTYDGKQPLKVQISTKPYVGDVPTEKKEPVSFPLYLITGSEYPDNLFYSEKDNFITVNEKFFTVTRESSYENLISENDTTRHMEIQVGREYLLYDGKQAQLSAPAFINEDGVVMLPLRETAQHLGASIHVDYDKEKQTVIIQMYSRKIILPLEANQYFVNDIPISYTVPMAVKEGKTFLSATDIAEILSIPANAVHWNPDTQILMIN